MGRHALARTGMLVAVLAVVPGALEAQQGEPEHVIDIGGDLDSHLLHEGIHGPEQPGRDAPYHEFFRECSFRWFGNEWSMELPVFPGAHNEVTFRAKLHRNIGLSFDRGFQVAVEGRGDETYEYRVVLPPEAIGPYERIGVRGSADPPYERGESRDRRELAWAVDWIRVRAIGGPPEGVPMAQATGPVEWPEEHFVNIGAEGDQEAIISGAYQREGYNPASRHEFYRWCNFRWFGNEWALRLPVFPGRHNEIALRANFGRVLHLSVPEVLEGALWMGGANSYENRLILLADMVGERESIELHGRAVKPYVVRPESRDKRELVITIDWARVRPLEEVPEGIMNVQGLPEEREADLPLPFRLRGTEMRPLVTDVDSYVLQARLMRCNVMTIGPMNGHHYTAFETENGIPYPKMEPDFIPRQIEALHQRGVAAIGWLPFNVQDTRKAEQCQAASKYPQWTMKFIEWGERPSEDKVGMCVVSSPWREVHAGILTEAAALGLDGVFFDGFYLGGVPHPTAAACTCRWCREGFKRETGLETPTQVDWTNPAFKRWVRWRNEKLIETGIYFRDRMREANPDLYVTCNYNIWPFGNKDWDTAIPIWSTDQFGVSQHAYTGRADLEWVMLGFKSRVSHDLNPKHSDIWRSSRYTWKYDGSPEDQARQELNMRTFMLSGLSYGTTPWHGGHIQPPEAGVRVHEEVRRRERFFSQDELRHLGVVLSQNTHDFYGHIPGSDNVADYRDIILGAWLLLTESHVPFRFVFDDQIEAGELQDYAALLLPNMACVSDEMAARLEDYVNAGGRLIVTADTGDYDEWGQPRQRNALAGINGIVRLEGAPLLEWLRTRDQEAAEGVLGAVQAAPPPIAVEAPKWLAVNATWAPGRKAIWLHMLNVSAFYPLGDTGFRGMGEQPVYAGDVASDADIMEGGKVKRRTVPARDVAVRVRGMRVKAARLGVAGTVIEADARGRCVVREVEIHEVLVLELQD